MISFKSFLWESKTSSWLSTSMATKTYDKFLRLKTVTSYQNEDSFNAGFMSNVLTYNYYGTIDTAIAVPYIKGLPQAPSSRAVYNKDSANRDTMILEGYYHGSTCDTLSLVRNFYVDSTTIQLTFDKSSKVFNLDYVDTVNWSADMTKIFSYKVYKWYGKDSLYSKTNFNYFNDSMGLVTFDSNYKVTPSLKYDVYNYEYSSYVVTTYKISGTVTTSTGAALKNDWIYLLNFNTTDSTLHVSDSMKTDASGKYSFLTNDSNLFVYADADSVNYPHEIPTYYDSTVVFFGAKPVVMNSDKVINFSTVYGMNPGGKGSVSGKVVFCALCKKGGAAAFVKIILTDSNNIPQAYTYTDASGNFSFNNLELKSYKVWVDKVGVKNSLAPSVKLTSSVVKLNNLSFTLYPDHLVLETVTGIEEATSENTALKIYPSPASDKLNIQFSGNANFRWAIIDAYGRQVLHSNTASASSASQSIDVTMLAQGIYLFKYVDMNGITGVEKFIKK